MIDDNLRKNPMFAPAGSPPSQNDERRFFHACSKGDDYGVSYYLCRYPHQAVHWLNPDGNGETGLHRAVLSDHPSTVRLLLDEGADIEAARICGSTPLLYAIASNAAETPALLLELGANPNSQDKLGRTPLMQALDVRRHDIIENLSFYGADFFLTDNAGDTVFDRAEHSVGAQTFLNLLLTLSAQRTETEICKEGIKASVVTTPLVFKSRPPRLKENPHAFIPYVPAIDAPTEQDRSNFFEACATGWEGRVRNTLKIFPEAVTWHQADKGDATGLHLAAKGNHGSIMALLLENNADPDARDTLLRTPLITAAEKQAVAAMNLLLKAGADPNLQNLWHINALMTLAEKEDTACLKLLLSYKPRLDLTDDWKMTALQRAELAGLIEPVRLLRDAHDMEDLKELNSGIKAAVRTQKTVLKPKI